MNNNMRRKRKKRIMKRKKMKINNNVCCLFFKSLILEYRNISDLCRKKKEKESMLNIIKSRKKKTKPTDNTFIKTTYLTERKKETRKKK